jgi:pyruvate formate lyase activating enzyme
MAAVNFGGAVPFSTIDWRGKASRAIFLRGCPLRCILFKNLVGTEEVKRIAKEFEEVG